MNYYAQVKNDNKLSDGAYVSQVSNLDDLKTWVNKLNLKGQGYTLRIWTSKTNSFILSNPPAKTMEIN